MMLFFYRAGFKKWCCFFTVKNCDTVHALSEIFFLTSTFKHRWRQKRRTFSHMALLRELEMEDKDTLHLRIAPIKEFVHLQL